MTGAGGEEVVTVSRVSGFGGVIAETGGATRSVVNAIPYKAIVRRTLGIRIFGSRAKRSRRIGSLLSNSGQTWNCGIMWKHRYIKGLQANVRVDLDSWELQF